METKVVKVVVRNFVVRDRKFVIVQDSNGWYEAIEDKYLDSEGKLTKRLNGFDMHAYKDLNQTLNSVKNWVEIEYLEQEEGYTRAKAIATVFNMLDNLEELEKAYSSL